MMLSFLNFWMFPSFFFIYSSQICLLCLILQFPLRNGYISNSLKYFDPFLPESTKTRTVCGNWESNFFPFICFFLALWPLHIFILICYSNFFIEASSIMRNMKSVGSEFFKIIHWSHLHPYFVFPTIVHIFVDLPIKFCLDYCSI